MSNLVSKFKHGQIVYLKIDPEQVPRMVTGWMVRPEHILYHLTGTDYETTHYAIEISTEKDELKSLGIDK